MIYKKSLRKWSAQTLEEKVQWIFDHYPIYKKNAELLCRQYTKTNARKSIGESVWKQIEGIRK